MKRASDSTVQLGLEANWKQFVLLVVINGFVGAMVGLERTVVPLIAEKDFGIVSGTAALSFIISFGVVKALLNLFAGVFADRFGRKRLLVIGWIIGLPVPGLIILAPEWSWVILANILLGINQGLCWSTTVIMKIDLVGAKRRGMAMGLNEFAGYVAVSLSALATGYLASVYGMRPYPFYPGIAFAAIGLILSIFFVRDTQAHARTEAQQHRESLSRLEENQLQSEEWTKSSFQPAGSERLHQPKQPPELTQFQDRASLGQVLLETSYRHRDLFSASQAGMINNLNDGMMWGLLPVYLAGLGVGMNRIGIVAAVYPAVWGIGQLMTGALSDVWGRKKLIFSGLWVQAVGIIALLAFPGFLYWVLAAAVMGIGTAMVYPTLLAAVSDVAHPQWRASALGVYRLWRDAGYAVGALISGLLTDLWGVNWAIGSVAIVTVLSGGIVKALMSDTL